MEEIQGIISAGGWDLTFAVKFRGYYTKKKHVDKAVICSEDLSQTKGVSFYLKRIGALRLKESSEQNMPG